MRYLQLFSFLIIWTMACDSITFEKGNGEISVNIDAEHGEKKYHANVSIQHKVDKDSAKASYKNGVLELKFSLVEAEKPKGKTVEVE